MNKAVDLGKLQAQFEAAQKASRSATKALVRAEEANEIAKAELVRSAQALKDGVKTVQG